MTARRDGAAMPIAADRQLPERNDSQLPQLFNLDAERSVLGTVMIHAECIHDAGLLTAGDWWLSKHAAIWRAIQKAHAERGTTDPLVVAEVLKADGRLDEVGGTVELLDLVELATAPASVAEHADIVRDYGQRRRAAETCTNVAVRIKEGDSFDDVLPMLHAVIEPRHGRDEDDLMTLAQLAAVPRRPHIVDGLILDDSFNGLIGPPKNFKTVLADAVCVAVADGGEWLGRRVMSPGVVIDYALEGLSGKADRYRAHIGAARFADPNDPIHQRLFLKRTVPNLATVSGQDAMLRTIEKAIKIAGMPLRMLKLDTWARAVAGAGLDENKTGDAGSFVAGLDRIRCKYPCAQLVVHHVNKQGEERGSSAVTGAADLLMFSHKQGKLEARVTVRDARDIEVPDPWLVTCCPVVVGQHEDGRHITALRIDTVRPCTEIASEDAKVAAGADDLLRRVVECVRVQGRGRADSANWIGQRVKANRGKVLQAIKEAVHVQQLVPDGAGYRLPALLPPVPSEAVPVPGPPYKGGEPRNQEPVGAGVVVPSGSGNQRNHPEPVAVGGEQAKPSARAVTAGADQFLDPTGTTPAPEPVPEPPAPATVVGSEDHGHAGKPKG